MSLNIKSQSAIEFMIILGTVMFFFTLLFISLNDRISDKVKEKNNLAIKEIALTVQDEIAFAYKSENGYQRNFQIPDLANSKEYFLNITDGSIYVITDDKNEAISLPLPSINGNAKKGNNIIKKNESGIFLNL